MNQAVKIDHAENSVLKVNIKIGTEHWIFK